MKRKIRNCVPLLAVPLSIASLFLGTHAKALDVIDPAGANYTGVSENSAYNGDYVSLNMFTDDVTAVSPGAILGGADYARAGEGPCYVAFQLNQAYTNVASIFYAQRAGGNPEQDKINTISIWASSSSAFVPEDPGVSPDAVVDVTNVTGAQWTEYLLPNTISGQYFLIRLDQTTPSGNPGGKEFRLGAALGVAPTVVQVPTDKTVYEGADVGFRIAAGGTLPLTYQWFRGANPLSDGGRIAGSTTASLSISDVIPGDADTYSVTVSNPYGTTNRSVNLSIVNAPETAAQVSVVSKDPLAYWELNEPAGSSVALDMVGNFHGTYGATSVAGVVGPRPPDHPGFASTNTALQTTQFDLDSPVTVPPMNISTTNSVTILAWIYQDGLAGPQQPYTGIAFCRGGGTAAGLIFAADGTHLGYQWGGSRYDFDSGLVVPTNQWTLVAMVYTTNSTTLYCGTTNGLVLSSVDNFTQGGQSFSAPMKIGVDTDIGGSARTFHGMIDDVAFFDRALSSDDIQDIYSAATGIFPAVQILGQSPTALTVFQGEPINLMVQVSGTSAKPQLHVLVTHAGVNSLKQMLSPHLSGNATIVI